MWVGRWGLIFEFLRSLGPWVRNSAHEQDGSWNRKVPSVHVLAAFVQFFYMSTRGRQSKCSVKSGFYLLTTSTVWIQFRLKFILLMCFKKRKTLFKLYLCWSVVEGIKRDDLP